MICYLCEYFPFGFRVSNTPAKSLENVMSPQTNPFKVAFQVIQAMFSESELYIKQQLMEVKLH